MYIELGKLTVIVERAVRFRWRPISEVHSENDPYLQDYYNNVWWSETSWLGLSIGLRISADSGRWWWQRD